MKTGANAKMPSDLSDDDPCPKKIRSDDRLEELEPSSIRQGSSRLLVKRGLDILLASIGLLLSAPVLVMAAAAIRIEDGGPMLSHQTRCGANGRTFGMMRLRTQAHAPSDRAAKGSDTIEPETAGFEIRRSSRSTRVGAFLHHLALDELPQLWNVLIGDMSVVGPRPAAPAEVARYRDAERRRLDMRPGILGLRQVGVQGISASHPGHQLDVRYVDSWSLGLDCKILLRAVPDIVRGPGSS